MNPRMLIAAAASVLAFAAPAPAQDWNDEPSAYELAQAGPSRQSVIDRERAESANDDMRALVYSPEFIMENRRAIALSDRQRDQMVAELQGLQSRLIAKQVAMEDARDALLTALRANAVDEARALSALDAVLTIERDVKRAQFQSLLRVRNALTPAQRSQLNQIRDGASPG